MTELKVTLMLASHRYQMLHRGLRALLSQTSQELTALREAHSIVTLLQ